MSQHMTTVAQTANKKFNGSTVAIRAIDVNEYFLVVKRKEPINPEKPYFTIKGGIQNPNNTHTFSAHFYSGDYDLTALDAATQFNKYRF